MAGVTSGRHTKDSYCTKLSQGNCLVNDYCELLDFKCIICIYNKKLVAVHGLKLEIGNWEEQYKSPPASPERERWRAGMNA